MLTVDQARQQFCAKLSPTSKVVALPLMQAQGKILAEDVVATMDIPNVDNSAMDGYAVNAADITVVPADMPVSQRIQAGAFPAPLAKNSVARIFTGGTIPSGSDAVIIQENTEEQADGAVRFLKQPRIGDNIRPKGQDIKNGATVIEAGRRLSSADLAVIASVGLDRVAVYEPITVAVFSTGDELVEPGQALKDGQVYNSNRVMLKALCVANGYQVVDCGAVEDTLEATKQALLNAAQQADVIISSGGVSVGDADFVKPAVEELGVLEHWKIRMKPGKPVAFGQIADSVFIGLPGNPVSSYITYQVIALPVLKALQGQDWQTEQSYKVIADFEKREADREEFIRVRTDSNQEHIRVTPYHTSSSGVMSSLSWAQGVVRQHIGQTIQKGDMVDFIPLGADWL